MTSSIFLVRNFTSQQSKETFPTDTSLFIRRSMPKTDDLVSDLQLRHQKPSIRDVVENEPSALHERVSGKANFAHYPITQCSCEVLARFGFLSLCKRHNDCYETNQVDVIPKAMNPPNCPQLRPIEQFWAIVKRKLKKSGRSATDAKQMLQKWNFHAGKVSTELVQKLMGSITNIYTKSSFLNNLAIRFYNHKNLNKLRFKQD
jgi:hypothetical protein